MGGKNPKQTQNNELNMDIPKSTINKARKKGIKILKQAL